jgi:hypothetical protein
VGVLFYVPLIDASALPSTSPPHRQDDLVIRKGGVRTVVDWKTSARRWPEAKADTDLQATCYLWAEHQQGRADTRLCLDVVPKTKSPVCERHHATRSPVDFTQLDEPVRVLERIVANECFLPRTGSWECANWAYRTTCGNRHQRHPIPG